VVKAGEAFPVEIVPQDEWGSLAKNKAWSSHVWVN